MQMSKSECYDKECKNRDLVENRCVVLVRWHDASYQDGPIYIEDIKKEFILESVGQLMYEDENSITIGMDWHSKRNYWRHVCHIPKGMIKDIIKISIPESFKEK